MSILSGFRTVSSGADKRRCGRITDTYRGSDMNNAASYWSPLCEMVMHLRCWARVGWKEGASTQATRWGQLLTIPTAGYLEASGGPIPVRDVEWVEVSTSHIKGGLAGRPWQMISAKEELLTGLRETQLNWELVESMWSVDGLFEDEPVQVVRVLNPLG